MAGDERDCVGACWRKRAKRIALAAIRAERLDIIIAAISCGGRNDISGSACEKSESVKRRNDIREK